MKENQNLIGYNVWSGTDYNNNLNEIISIHSGLTAKSSNTWSIQGENSIFVKSLQDGYQAIILYQNTFTQGTVVNAKMKLLHPKGGSLYCRLLEISSNKYNDVAIPLSDNIINVTISRTVTVNTKVQLIILSRLTGNEVYIDDITLTTS